MTQYSDGLSVYSQGSIAFHAAPAVSLNLLSLSVLTQRFGRPASDSLLQFHLLATMVGLLIAGCFDAGASGCGLFVK